MTPRLWSWSHAHKGHTTTSLLSFFLSLTPPPATGFLSHHSLIFSFNPSLTISLSLTRALSLQWWVIKVARAIPLPRGWETYSKAAEIKMKTN